MPPVIVDTSIWIQAFRVPTSTEKGEVERLIRTKDAAIMGIVHVELMAGARSESELLALERRLGVVEFLETNKDVWQRAGRILYGLRCRGQTIAVPDAVIAAQALEYDCEVYTLDDHFQRVPELRLHATSV